MWFRRRSRCAFSPAHAACLRAAYRERIELLAALSGRRGDPGSPPVPATCPGAPWGSGPVHLQANDPASLTIRNARGRVLLVASALPPRDDWSPFLRLVNEDGGIRLESGGRTVVRCRALRPPALPLTRQEQRPQERAVEIWPAQDAGAGSTPPPPGGSGGAGRRP